ncbi:MAG: thioredoxin domain-containing protein [Alphaproteobacteria bacterium]|nr:thioredoxin domain-containing protein [Alphaproteobacteria bacterium]
MTTDLLAKVQEPKNRVAAITDEDFKERVLEHKGDVVAVLFYAWWCSWCRDIMPTYEEFARDTAQRNNTKFCIMNIDEEPLTAEKYKTNTLPTIIYFCEGKVQKQTFGSVPQSRLQNDLDKVLRENCHSGNRPHSPLGETGLIPKP